MNNIVTDMGGVIIDLFWEEYAYRLLEKRFDIEELIQIWINGKSTGGFETGANTDFDIFAAEFRREFNPRLTEEQIKQYFMAIAGAPKEDFFEIFGKLKKTGYSISVLSNTNPAHVEHLENNYDLFNVFDHKFLSYETGFLKPRREAYEYVIGKLETRPSDILFFDDSSTNVRAAADCGINAFQVRSPAEIYEIVTGVSWQKRKSRLI